MLQITPQMRIWVAIDPVDFRKGIESLAAVCRKQLELDPYSGMIFLFRNRSRTSVKILTYDGQGFWLAMKRWSSGKLHWWPESTHHVAAVLPSELQILLWNGNPERADIPPNWRELHTSTTPSTEGRDSR